MSRRRIPFDSTIAAALAVVVAAAAGGAQPPPAAAAPAPDGAHDSTRRAAVAGSVYDSTFAAPLAGALVQLSDRADPTRAHSTTTDSLGRYRIDGVAPGRYLAGFIHQALDVLGLETPLYLVEVKDDSLARLDLAVPGPRRVRAAICGADIAADSAGLLVGFALEAESGAALREARILVSWSELELGRRVQLSPRHLTIAAAPDGRFAACGVPVDADLTATAEAPGYRSGVVELRPTAFGVERRDFLLGPRAAAVGPTGAASLTGVVRGQDGRPAPRVRVVILDAERGAETREDGTFTMAGLPSGTYTVEARSVGYVPARAVVDLTSARPATVALAFDQRAQALERIVVKGRGRMRVARHDEFLKRRQERAFGHFVTAADIERRSVSHLTDALRTTPGLQVVPGARGRSVIRGRGGCVPTLYLDGVAVYAGADDIDLLITPQTVYGVEIYLGLGSIPVQFSNTTNGCGSVVVWTK